MGWRIREASRADLGLMGSLLEASGAAVWSRAALRSALTARGARVRLAEDARGVAAGLLVARRVADQLEIDLVGVRPAHRRRGAGAALLRRLLAEEARSGAAGARLELRAANAPARSLYERLGFVVVGTRARYYPDGEDALLLSRALERDAAREGGLVVDGGQDGAQQIPIRDHARVLSNRSDGAGRVLELEVPGWPGARPGQFVMLGAGAESASVRRDPLLPRPMAVYRELDPASEPQGRAPRRIEVLYRVVGRGTTLLSEANVGDRVSIVGPLGNGFPLDPEGGPAILVGGGTGIASLYELARRLGALGREVRILLGARGEADLIGRSDFESLDLTLQCTTEDGSFGRRGLVTEPLEAWLAAPDRPESLYVCGPTPMMRAAADLAATHGVRCLVSLENPMACGFGVCLGCAAPLREGGYALVCRQGPVFEAEDVAWEGLA